MGGGDMGGGEGCETLPNADCLMRTDCNWDDTTQKCHYSSGGGGNGTQPGCHDATTAAACAGAAEHGCKWDDTNWKCFHYGGGDGSQPGCGDAHTEADCAGAAEHGCKWDDSMGCYHDSGDGHQPGCGDAHTEADCAGAVEHGCKWDDTNWKCFHDGGDHGSQDDCRPREQIKCSPADGCKWDDYNGCYHDSGDGSQPDEATTTTVWSSDNTQTTTAGAIEVDFTPEQVLGWGQDSKFRQWQVYVVYGGWCFQKYGNWPRKHWNEEGKWGQWCDKRFGGFSAQWWYSYTDKGRACFDGIEGDKNDGEVLAAFDSWGAYGERCRNEYLNHNVWHRSEEIMDEQMEHGGMISNVHPNLRGGHQPEL